jgi:glucoamylase
MSQKSAIFFSDNANKRPDKRGAEEMTKYHLIGLRIAMFFGICFVSGGPAFAVEPQALASLDDWLSFQVPQSQTLMLANISRPGAAAGSVVAAPGQSPNYYYHWIRDSGLTMDTIVTLFENTQSDSDRDLYNKTLGDFIDFSKQLQATNNQSGAAYSTGLGDPRFNVDGSADTTHWGRPQDDGAAIRASTLMRLGNAMIDQGQIQWVSSNLYSSGLPATSVIKADLEFIAHHWMDSSYDLWEEIQGDHFYTRMVQRRAMVEGAEFAERMGDGEASGYYQIQAQQIEQSLDNFWNGTDNYIVATLNQTAGPTIKTSDLDSAVILGILHGTIQLHTRGLTADEVQFGVTDDRVIVTALTLESKFASLYPINGAGDAELAPAMGRYAEDRYNGFISNAQGNPWFLMTNAFAEYYYRAASLYQKNQEIAVTPVVASWIKSLPGAASLDVSENETIANSDPRFETIISLLKNRGDQFFARTQTYSVSTGEMSEEIDRNTGAQTGAQNLTWSHASVLTTFWARQSLTLRPRERRLPRPHYFAR